jgi:hypothetical protein
MEITQIQLTYNELQDRVIARINLGVDQHLSFILTRRICKFMIENLAAFLKIDLPKSAVPEKIDIVIQREWGASGIDDLQPHKIAEDPSDSEELPPGIQRDLPFEERSPEGNLLNRGHEPALVLNAVCNRSEEALIFTLMMDGKQSWNLNLNPTIATAINQLLMDVVKRSFWFEGFGVKKQASSGPTSMPTDEEKKTITYH